MAQPRRARGRRALVTLVAAAALVALTAALTLVLGAGSGGEALVTVQAGAALDAEADPGNEAPVGSPAGLDLREASVFLQSNDAGGNEIVAFSRADDGSLTEVDRYPTGGTGSGSFEDSAQGLVLGSADGEASPSQQVDDPDLLFATNAGDGTISVFRVFADRLEQVEHTPSGGSRPVSLTVNGGLLYVLNSGEIDRRLLLGGNAALENCAHGGTPTLVGFQVTPDGSLTRIPGSERSLSGTSESGCAQVSFTPDGTTIVVTERLPEVEEGRTGAVVTFSVAADGTLVDRRVQASAGNGPFGFTFTPAGTLLMSEQNGGYANPGGGGVAALAVDDGVVVPTGETVPNFQTDTCWIVVTADGRLAFASSPFEGGAVSAYSLGEGDALTLAHPVATAPDGRDVTQNVVSDGVTDLALSQDSRFLYQLNSFEGSLYVLRVEPTGLLSHVETLDVFDLEPFGAGGEAAPYGIAVR